MNDSLLNGLVVLAVIGVVSVWVLARNEVAYRARMAALKSYGWHSKFYSALPDYETMMFHPRHQLRWTPAQWIKFVKEAH